MNIVDSQKIRKIMLTKCVGISELARLAEVQPSVVSKILRRDSPCRLKTIGKLANALNVNAEELVKE